MKVEVASTLGARLRGLYGHGGFDGVLLLVPCNDVHTLFMKRALDVAFVDEAGIVIETHRAVAPNRRLRNSRASVTLERFAQASPWFEPGDRFDRRMHARESALTDRSERSS